MKFVSELSEAIFTSSFKWQINVWKIPEIDPYEKFEYAVQSESIDFPEIDAKWIVKVTEDVYHNMNPDKVRAFEVDLKVIPNQSYDSGNQKFHFELKVKDVMETHVREGYTNYESIANFEIPIDQKCIKLEASCKVKKMVTTTRETDSDHSDEEVAEGSEQGSFYESLIEDPVSESSRKKINPPTIDYDNDCVFGGEQFVYVEKDTEKMETHSNNDSSENSSFEKIEESSHESVEQPSTSSSTKSAIKSETGTDYACLESIPDEEETIRENKPGLSDKDREFLLSLQKGNNEEVEQHEKLARWPYLSSYKASGAETEGESWPFRKSFNEAVRKASASNDASSEAEVDLFEQRQLTFNQKLDEVRKTEAALKAKATDDLVKQPVVVAADVHQEPPKPTPAEVEPKSDEKPRPNSYRFFKRKTNPEPKAASSPVKESKNSNQQIRVSASQFLQGEDIMTTIEKMYFEAGGNISFSSQFAYSDDEKPDGGKDSDSEDSDDDQSTVTKSINSSLEDEPLLAKEEDLMKRISDLHFDQMKREADNRSKLFILGAKMNFAPLVADCASQLSKIVNVNNFLDIYGIAEELKNEQLIKTVVDFVVQSRYISFFTEEFPPALIQKVRDEIDMQREMKHQFSDC